MADNKGLDENLKKGIEKDVEERNKIREAKEKDAEARPKMFEEITKKTEQRDKERAATR